MKRILRLLLIAAVALPLWQSAAAQEVKPERTSFPKKVNVQEMKDAALKNQHNVIPKASVIDMHKASTKADNMTATLFESSTGTNKYIPVYGWNYDENGQTSQMIYPASLLEGFLNVGEKISKLTFYTDDNGIKFSGGRLTFTIGETTTNQLSDGLINTPSTTVSGTVVPTNGSTTLSVVFTTPLEYTGNNLFVQVKNTGVGTCDPSESDNTLWLGESDLFINASYYASYCNAAGRQQFLPKVTIEKYVDLSQLAARDITVKDKAFFSGKSYTWTDSEGTHTSYLNEIATVPEQMIAMVKKIYTDPEIPGNLKRGFAANGTDNGETNQEVYYSGVGTVNLIGNVVDDPDSYEWKDGFGWGIEGDINEIKESSYLAWEVNQNTNTYIDYLAFYAPFDKGQYNPDKEGLTLLLVELKDTYVDGSNNAITSGTYDTEYDRLKAYFANTVKSIRVITEAKRTGEGVEAGTLFKIDCEKMNKFFLLAKGQLHLDHNSFLYTADLASYLFTGDSYLYDNWDFAPEPGGIFYYKNTYPNYTYWYYGYRPTFSGQFFTECHVTEPFFYHMFEQFSPSMPSDTQGALDLYQNMTTNMESFPVIHDCLGITYMNHQFMLYGADSEDDDCQDIHDLMFFVPDYRMLKDDNRDPTSYTEQYLNYNQNFKPTMGLFVIKQNEITGEQIDGQDTYKLHLTWNSNLLDFLPGEDGKYKLYRVITNPDGTKTYQQVGGNFSPNTLEYFDNVPMQQNGQQVTYVVQGQDWDEFLDLQMSNEESYIIPGLDRAEQLRIDLNSDYYFSRYDAADQTNNYSNSLIANNTVGTNVKPQYLENGSQFKFWRATIDAQTGDVVTPENPFVVAEVSNWNASTGGTLTYKDWNDQTNFSSKPYGHGYHANPTTSTISVANGEVVFDGLKLYDNFSVDVSENAHPAQYVYYVTLHTSVPFELGTNGVPDIATWQNGKTFVYFEAYTNWTDVRAWAWDSNNNDYNYTGGSWPGEAMEYVGMHGTNAVYRWAIPQGQDGPNMILFNWSDNGRQQTGNFGFANGGYYTTSGMVNVISTSQEARSNTVSVPVYKTDMAMDPISAQDVEEDVTHQFPAATKFDVNARYSSRSEILGYYIYRWASDETPTIYESDGADSSPQGQAGNQGEYYTVAMNTDFTGRTENFGANYADVTASFEDNYMVNEAENGDTYTYAPVVELYAPVQAVNLPSGADRTDYNTYGGPQQMTAGGVVNVQVLKPAQSEYTWTANGKTYTYYNVFLDITKLDLPAGYEVAKVRAWRKIESQYLGEQKDKGYEGRLDLDVNGEYKFVEHATCAEGEELGSTGSNNVFEGTFGAVKLNPGETIPMEFTVRVYFTKSVSGAKAADPNGDYYIAEYTISDALTSDIPTSINGVESYRQVVSEKYYNPAGVESDTPFKGVNIVVTRYSDGSTSTVKVLK